MNCPNLWKLPLIFFDFYKKRGVVDQTRRILSENFVFI